MYGHPEVSSSCICMLPDRTRLVPNNGDGANRHTTRPRAVGPAFFLITFLELAGGDRSKKHLEVEDLP